MKPSQIRVAIVDDHQIVIDGITSLLDGHHNISIQATHTSAKKMLEILTHKDIDILLTDIMMPEMNGQELAKEVRKLYPHIKILALSMSGQGHTVNEMINDADIAGYILKNIGKQELTHAIEKIANGGIYFSDEVLKELEHYSNIRKENEDVNLTTREIEIIKLIEKEMSNKGIASTLFNAL
jgi:DNA-binding NarL/FixJ family response regulator